MRRKLTISLIAACGLITACAGAATPTAAPKPTDPPKPTSAPATAAPATAAPPTAAPKPTTAPPTAMPPTAMPKPTDAPKVRLSVLTSVEPLLNIVHNIAGDRVDLVGIVPPGTDSHTFEPAPSDAVRMSNADLIVLNGLVLEEPTRKLAEKNLKKGAEIVLLGEQTVKPDQFVFDFSFPKDGGKPNPHLWMNPLYALRYGEIVKDALSRRDPANAAFYSANYDKFKTRIDALDAAIKGAIETIPAKNRRLLTYHDSFAYFTPRYGMTVVGAIQPSDFAQPSAREVARLIEQIRAEKLPAIFGSEVFPSKVLDQIKKESGVAIIDTLADDALPGEPNAPNHTYFGMMVDDVIIMARALGGNPDNLAKFDATNTVGK